MEPGRTAIDCEVCAHDCAGLGLPPVVVDGHVEVAVAPYDGFRVEGFADGADEAEGRHVVLVDDLAAGAHEEADGGWCGVPDGDVVVLDDLVPAGGAEAAFVDDLGDSVGPRGHHAV